MNPGPVILPNYHQRAQSPLSLFFTRLHYPKSPHQELITPSILSISLFSEFFCFLVFVLPWRACVLTLVCFLVLWFFLSLALTIAYSWITLLSHPGYCCLLLFEPAWLLNKACKWIPNSIVTLIRNMHKPLMFMAMFWLLVYLLMLKYQIKFSVLTSHRIIKPRDQSWLQRVLNAGAIEQFKNIFYEIDPFYLMDNFPFNMDLDSSQVTSIF